MDQSAKGKGRNRNHRQRKGQPVFQPVHLVNILHPPQCKQRQQNDTQTAIEIAAIDRHQHQAKGAIGCDFSCITFGPCAQILGKQKNACGAQ